VNSSVWANKLILFRVFTFRTTARLKAAPFQTNLGCIFLLQAEALVHQALQARAVDEIVGEFFVGKHT
jgi:hypothetical protein